MDGKSAYVGYPVFYSLGSRMLSEEDSARGTPDLQDSETNAPRCARCRESRNAMTGEGDPAANDELQERSGGLGQGQDEDINLLWTRAILRTAKDDRMFNFICQVDQEESGSRLGMVAGILLQDMRSEGIETSTLVTDILKYAHEKQSGVTDGEQHLLRRRRIKEYIKDLKTARLWLQGCEHEDMRWKTSTMLRQYRSSFNAPTPSHEQPRGLLEEGHAAGADRLAIDPSREHGRRANVESVPPEVCGDQNAEAHSRRTCVGNLRQVSRDEDELHIDELTQEDDSHLHFFAEVAEGASQNNLNSESNAFHYDDIQQDIEILPARDNGDGAVTQSARGYWEIPDNVLSTWESEGVYLFPVGATNNSQNWNPFTARCNTIDEHLGFCAFRDWDPSA